MTASSRRSTLERYNQKKSISGKEWLADLLEKRRLKTSIGLLLQQRLQGAQKSKPKTYDFSSDTASADAFAAKFENARWFVFMFCSKHGPTSETIRPTTLLYEEEREDVSSEGLYPGLENATPDWVWTASLTKPVQRCQTLYRYLEILKFGLKFNRDINGF